MSEVGYATPKNDMQHILGLYAGWQALMRIQQCAMLLSPTLLEPPVPCRGCQCHLNPVFLFFLQLSPACPICRSATQHRSAASARLAVCGGRHGRGPTPEVT